MDIQAPYYRQVALLMQVLPYVAVEREFALKGGTAINLFIRDFPRLSVDIDLASGAPGKQSHRFTSYTGCACTYCRQSATTGRYERCITS